MVEGLLGESLPPPTGKWKNTEARASAV